ncbi:MAG: DUF6249 domain-containing protein, partial [Phocaeicola sp.]
LFARRKERLLIIEKLAEKLDETSLKGKFVIPSFGTPQRKYTALKVGCLLLGIGLGVLVGLLLSVSIDEIRDNHEFRSAAYGSSVLLFGGIGLLIAFLVEVKLNKDEKDKE